MDFKMEMQNRIDAGMNPDEAYYETRDFYASILDYDTRLASSCIPNGCCATDDLEICDCTSEIDCECKEAEE